MIKELLERKKIQKINFLESGKVGTYYIDDLVECAPGCFVTADIQESEGLNILNVYLEGPAQLKTELEHFRKNEVIEEINFNGTIDFSKAEDLSHQFSDCIHLKKIDFGNTSFENLKISRGMFECCKDLEELIGFDFNCPKLENSEYSFYKCENISKIDFGNANLSSLKYAMHMFYKCSKLKTIDMSNITLSSLINATSMFENCMRLESVCIKEISKCTNSRYMFADCTRLKNTNINFNFKKLECCNHMFYKCISLESFEFHKFAPEKLEDIPLMFSGCIKLKGPVIFPEFEYMGTEAYGMFEGCSNITTIDMSKVTMPKITTLTNFAKNCTSLQSIEMGKMKTTKLVIDSFVRQCNNLAYVSFNEIEDVKEIFASDFANGCSNLTVVRMGWELDKLKSTIRMFKDCSSLRFLEYKKQENIVLGYAMKNMFQGCSNIYALNMKELQIYNNDNINFPDQLKLLYIEKKQKEQYLDLIDERKTVIAFKD